MAELINSALEKKIKGYFFQNYVQILKYICVGFATLGIYYLVFYVFCSLIQLDYRIAITIAYVITLISNFLLHRIFTYEAKLQILSHNIYKYSLLITSNYFTTLAIIWFVVDVTKSSPYFSLLIVAAATSLQNFFVMKYFVFRCKEKSLKK